MPFPWQYGQVQTLDGRVVPVDPSLLTIQFDASASPILYLGEALIGTSPSSPNWRIQRFDTTSGVAQTWAEGNAAFMHVWTDRASLPYS